MIKKRVLVNDVINFLKDDLLKVFGDCNEEYVIDNIADSAHVTSTSLDWVNPRKNDKQIICENSKAKVLLADNSINYSDVIRKENKVLLIVDNPKLSLIKIINKFFTPKFSPYIDPTAVIHPNAIIGKNNFIGPNCYIGNCIIGDGNIIHSNVSIYDRTIIGDKNVIHSGAVICVDGLGCIRETNGTLIEFPQIGGVVIGNNTYIGANTHIASGSLSNTIISDGCKINGMCFIGSNDILHENVWITGSTMLAGSVTIGRNTTIFSRVVVRDWCNVGENVVLGMGSIITKNVPNNEIWVGCPAKKYKDNL